MFLRKVSGAYAGGVVGILIAIGTLWLLNQSGLTARLDIALRADLTSAGLYRHIVWGGIWGLLFLLPVWRGQPIRRGLLFALVPVAVVLFLVFPERGRGYLGLGYGTFAPVLVLTLGFLWGIIAAVWHKGS